MNLNLLSDIHSKVTEIKEQRHNNGKTLVDSGLQLLARAQSENFENRETLVKASEQLLDALRYNRKQPEPYIGLAYIYFLFGQYPKASPFLTEVLLIDPQNTDAQMLLKRIHQPDTDTNANQSEMSISATDLLVEQLKPQIQKACLDLTKLPQNWICLTSEAHMLSQMELRLNDLEQLLHSLKNEITKFENDTNGLELHMLLRPFEKSFKQYKTIVQQSKVLVQISAAIQKEFNWVISVLKQLTQSGERFATDFSEARLEECLDKSEEIADQLDEFDQQGLCPSALLEEYETWVKWINALQERLD
ncbi:MAG: tetratricopeptide repeat protein [Candidatus Sericytochromatia bacterium]